MDNLAVDYFSLDIEGAEYQVLKTIPFKEVNIKLIGVEIENAGKIFNGTEADISTLLAGYNYQYVGRSRLDKFYMINEQMKNSGLIKIITVS